MAGDLGEPAVEREVLALAADRDRLVHAAVQQDVAAGEHRPGRGRVEAVAAVTVRVLEAGGQPPLPGVGDAVDAEQRPLAPGERSHARPDLLRPKESEALAVLRQVALERLRVLGQDQVA